MRSRWKKLTISSYFIIFMLHNQSEDIESMHGVHGRWRQSNQEYQECLHSLAMEEWEVILISHF